MSEPTKSISEMTIEERAAYASELNARRCAKILAEIEQIERDRAALRTQYKAADAEFKQQIKDCRERMKIWQ
jgi:flagellar motility protein MotE (MotC chaperone)